MTVNEEQREPRTVVIATDSLILSGVGEHILTLGRALSKRYHVIVAFPANGGGPGMLAALFAKRERRDFIQIVFSFET